MKRVLALAAAVAAVALGWAWWEPPARQVGRRLGMSIVNGVDSTHALDHDALKRHSIGAVGRYLDNPSGHADDWKATDKAENDGYRAAKIATFYAWETTATRALDGYDTGVLDGRRARASIRALGVPDSVPAIATCDTNAAPAKTIGYGRGFHATTGVVGIYGSAGVIDAWHADGIIGDRYGWQTNAHGWDNPRRFSDHASIRQQLPADLNGLGNVDPDIIDATSPLVWWTTAVKPAWTPPSFPGVARYGCPVPVAEAWAFLLRAIGYQGFNVTGPFGVGKYHATRRFQKRHGLKADGIAGLATHAAAVKLLIAKRKAKGLPT